MRELNVNEIKEVNGGNIIRVVAKVVKKIIENTSDEHWQEMGEQETRRNTRP